jgi:crossover junction endodeoxyribonuclease RusA
MLSSELCITIPGHPAPKGSLKCIGGRGGRGHVLIEDNPRTKEWRTLVAGWINKRYVRPGVTAELGQALGAEITFTLERPKGHYGTGRNSRVIRGAAPTYPVSHATGDVDKLLRLILDALQDAGLLPDDSQVCEVTARKGFVTDPGPAKTPDAVFVSDLLPYPGVRIRLYPL